MVCGVCVMRHCVQFLPAVTAIDTVLTVGSVYTRIDKTVKTKSESGEISEETVAFCLDQSSFISIERPMASQQ